jgi:Carboxypeptidase regulatory-like domain
MRRIKLNGLLVRVLVSMLLQLTVQSAVAQANRATITGTVTDASGAILTDVEVTAINTGTSVPTKTVSNQDGIYVIPNLFPGEYSLTFKKDGFEILRHPTVSLDSTQVARIDAALKVGAISESVTVTSDAPVLDLEKPSEGTNMKGAVVNDLPLSIYGGGRFVEDFAVAITPGYSPISSPYGAVVNGGQWFTKDYTVDGTSATSSIPGDSMETGPSMEAVQELQAQTSGLDVQSSITGGGVMSFNLKSGTNRFHGSSFLYGHNELLDANTWNNDNLGLRKSKARAWDYGASLGGPIFRNKTFFFGTFERYTQNDFRLGGPGATVPTQAFLGGDFSALLDTTKLLGTDTHSNPIYAGAIFNPSDPGAVFVGNIIPTSTFSPVSQKIVAIYQKSYVPQFPGIDANLRGLIQNSPSQTPNQAVIKLDHNLSDRDRLSGSWVYNHRPRTLVDSGGPWAPGSTDGGPLSAARLQLVRSHEWRVTESHTFSPRILNVLNLTYNWYWNGSFPAAASNWSSQLGFGSTGASNFPSISFGDSIGHTETGLGNGFQGNVVGATTILGDSVTWTKGRHNITFGGDFHASQVNSHSGSGALSFGFSSNTTGAPSQGYSNQVGFAFASFLLGDVNTASQTTPFNLYGREKTMSLYAQDSYKVRSDLTLSLGLRWNYNFRFHEKNGSWANYDLNAIDPTLGIPGALVFAKNGSDSFEKKEYPLNFGPQIGFAYSPWKKAVFRGSFGIIYNPPGVPYFNGVPNGFAPGFQGTNSVSAPFNWDGGYPGVFQPGNKNVDPTTLFPFPTSIDPRALRVGYSDAFNFGVQYELTPNTRVEASYVGNRGHRLTDTALAWNEGPTATFLRLAAQYPSGKDALNAFNHYVCSAADAASYGVAYPYAGFCAPLLAAIAPYPQMAATEGSYWFFPDLLYAGLPLGQSYYDSMIIDVVKRTGRGLTMDMSYTLSRQEGDTFSAQQENNGYYTPIQDFNHIGVAAHSLTNYDQKHIVKGFVSYELPFGKGQRWVSSQGRVVNRIVGGWSVAGLFLYASGQPFAVSAQNPYYPLWGNLYPNFDLSGFHGPANPRKFPSVQTYISDTVATNPAPGTLGTGPAAVSALRCPGSSNENASLLKYVPMGSDGQYKLSFRAEFYNLFNRHTYNINGCGGNKSTAGFSNFGEIFGVNDGPRNGQFAIRFDF